MVYSLIVSDADGFVNRAEVRDRVDELLADLGDKASGFDPESWGTDERAQAGMAAAEAMIPPSRP